VDIRTNSILPAIRQDIDLHTADGLTIVGEVAAPAARPNADLPASILSTQPPLRGA
jgi:hypothetical protein